MSGISYLLSVKYSMTRVFGYGKLLEIRSFMLQFSVTKPVYGIGCELNYI